MNPDHSPIISRDFQSIFAGAVRYEIPFFQRGYAWQKDEWKELLTDLEEQVMAEVGEDGNFADHEHFFGPVVVLEKPNAPHPNLKQFLIIDGQQRLTTVYVLLIVLHGLLRDKKAHSPQAEGHAQALAPLLRNQLSGATDSYLELKVFSSKGDRLPTYYALSGNQNPNSTSLAADMQLYVPSQNGIDALVTYLRRTLKGYDVPHLWQLAQAVTKSLKIVWIPLNSNDNPQAIFESLNGKGRPLSAAELLCNFMFRPLADDPATNHEQLHNEKWLRAQNRVGPDNFETYLRLLFSITQSKMIGKGRRLYTHYKSQHRDLSLTSALADLTRIEQGTQSYLWVTDPANHTPDDAPLARTLRGIAATSMTSAYPFLMAVLQNWQHGQLTLAETRQLLRETYVLLVRRKLSGLLTNRYDTFFPNLLSKLISEPDKPRALQKEALQEGLFVSNQQLEDALVAKELYNQRDLPFARYVLEQLDQRLQAHGEMPDYTTINTIEHVMPQTLDEDWKLDLGPAEANDVNLPRLRHTLGNLGLNSQSANSTYGNKSFAVKKTQYAHPKSALTAAILAHPGPWNSAAIQDNSRQLAGTAQLVWAWTPPLIH